MDLREAAQEIRDTVSMDSILGIYGYTTKGGFMPCPFHGDHAPSLKVYKGTGGWHCFGCGRGGSAIDFVMEHEGCSFHVAVKAIDRAMGLGLLEDEDPFVYEERRALQRKYDAFAVDMAEGIDTTQKLIDLDLGELFRHYQDLEAIPKHDRTSAQWTELLALKDEMLRLEDVSRQLEELERSVKAWRAGKRRAQGKSRPGKARSA